MFMRMSIANNIKSALPEIENAKEFMKYVEERSQTVDKSLAWTLMSYHRHCFLLRCCQMKYQTPNWRHCGPITINVRNWTKYKGWWHCWSTKHLRWTRRKNIFLQWKICVSWWHLLVGKLDKHVLVVVYNAEYLWWLIEGGLKLDLLSKLCNIWKRPNMMRVVIGMVWLTIEWYFILLFKKELM